MRVGRAYDHRICLIVQSEVVGEASSSLQEPGVFLAERRAADCLERGFVKTYCIRRHVARHVISSTP
jgi:hypothetical protein